MGNQQSSQVDKWPQFLDLDLSANLKEPVEAKMSGTIPNWLSGSLYRNGSGLYQIGETRSNHLFDGYAVIHRWSIKNGKVTYLSTLLDSDSYKKSVKYNRLVGGTFSFSFPDPCKSIFDRLFTYFQMEKSDNTAVNIVEHGDRLFAMTETSVIHEVNEKSLLSDGKVDIGDTVAVHTGTAHPHIDTEGNMFYYGSNPKDFERTYNIVRVEPAGKGEAPFSKAEIVASIPRRWKLSYGYTHSFGMTDNYFIHLELPLVFSIPKLLSLKFWGGIEKCFINYPEETIQIHVFDRKTGQTLPINFYTPHGFVFHFVNCYEESGFLVCDVCLNKSGNYIRELYLENLVHMQQTKTDFMCYYARFVLPLSIEGATPGENLVTLPGSKATAVLRPGTDNCVDVTNDAMFGDSAFFEMPRINYDFNGKKFRYAYGCSLFNSSNQRVMKLDVQERKLTEWRCGDNHYAGEPVFVKNPAGKSEDDGVLLCPVLAETTEQSSYLVVLDASSLEEIGRATVPSDIKMNFTFHGGFTDKLH